MAELWTQFVVTQQIPIVFPTKSCADIFGKQFWRTCAALVNRYLNTISPLVPICWRRCGLSPTERCNLRRNCLLSWDIPLVKRLQRSSKSVPLGYLRVKGEISQKHDTSSYSSLFEVHCVPCQVPPWGNSHIFCSGHQASLEAFSDIEFVLFIRLEHLRHAVSILAPFRLADAYLSRVSLYKPIQISRKFPAGANFMPESQALVTCNPKLGLGRLTVSNAV